MNQVSFLSNLVGVATNGQKVQPVVCTKKSQVGAVELTVSCRRLKIYRLDGYSYHALKLKQMNK